MDRISFRYKVNDMLINKSDEYSKYVLNKVDKILEITKKDDMQLETVAFIMLEADRIYENKDTNE